MKIPPRLVLLIILSLLIVGEAKEKNEKDKQARPKRFDLKDVKKLLLAKGIDLSDPRKKRCEDGCDEDNAAAARGGDRQSTDPLTDPNTAPSPPGTYDNPVGGGAAAGGITCQCTCNSLPLL